MTRMEIDELNDLIKAVKSGKTREFSRLIREFGLQVRSFVHSRVQNREDAEDIAQQVFIAAYQGISIFDMLPRIKICGSVGIWRRGL
jgi:RNA polymerase sigma-70 factor, ECF subfamily